MCSLCWFVCECVCTWDIIVHKKSSLVNLPERSHKQTDLEGFPNSQMLTLVRVPVSCIVSHLGPLRHAREQTCQSIYSLLAAEPFRTVWVCFTLPQSRAVLIARQTPENAAVFSSPRSDICCELLLVTGPGDATGRDNQYLTTPEFASPLGTSRLRSRVHGSKCA